VEDSRGHGTRFGSFLRWLLLAVLVCAAGLVVFRQVVADRLDEEIRARIEADLASHYRDMEVSIERVRRVEGKGIEIRGLSIRSLHGITAYRNLVRIDELFLECRADLNELLLDKPRVRRLIVRRMKLQATCDEDGRWNLAGLLPLPDFGGSVPTILVEDSTLQLQDLCRHSGCVWALDNIDVQLQSKMVEQRQHWHVTGGLQGDHFKDVSLVGIVDPEQGSWSAKGTVKGLDMSERLLDALPNDLAQYASVLATLRARAEIDFRLDHVPGASEPIRVRVDGQVSDGRLDDPRLPMPLTALEAKIHCSNRQIRIQDVTAQAGQTSLKLDCVCTDLMSESPQLQLSASVTHLPLDERLHAVLPETLHDDWNKFMPAGHVDAEIELTMEDRRLQRDVTLTCRDVSFSYHKFPLRMYQGNGKITWVGDQLEIIDFTAVAGSEVLHFHGSLQNPGPDSTGWMELRSAGPIELDHNLISAMTESGQRIMRSLKPTGHIMLTRGIIEKQLPGQLPHTRWELVLTDCSVEYERFPYAIHKISGQVVLENRHWLFSDLRGYHGSSRIRCNGNWVPLYQDQPGGTLSLKFHCDDVSLNDSLRHAVGVLNPGAERFWSGLRPRGTLDQVGIDMRYNSVSRQSSYAITASKEPADNAADGRTITLHPEWFPVRLEDCTGELSFRDGKFELKNVKARRGGSDVELAGHGRVLPDQRWEIVLTPLFADAWSVDHELMDAFPESARRGIRQLKYRGTLSLNGKAWFRGGADQQLQAGWDVMLDIHDGAIENQLELAHIFGGVRLTGGTDAQGFRSRGMLDVDSVMAHGFQLTQLQGPIWLDARQLILGATASTRTPPQPVTARALGGVLEITDARVNLDEQMNFMLNASLADAAARDFARAFHSQRHDISGKVFALVKLKGAKAGLHKLQGTGQVRLRQADIYELPVMTRLLSLLNRPPDTSGFTSADVDFQLDGEVIRLARVDVAGEVITLKGDGWLDLNRQINMNFYALVGNQEFQWPVIRTLLAEASKSILLIQVVGDVDNPQVIKKPLPDLDDTLQRLFPEAATPSVTR
jgi:hypothetical protein